MLVLGLWPVVCSLLADDSLEGHSCFCIHRIGWFNQFERDNPLEVVWGRRHGDEEGADVQLDTAHLDIVSRPPLVHLDVTLDANDVVRLVESTFLTFHRFYSKRSLKL